MAEMKGYFWDGKLHKVPVRDSQRQKAYDAELKAFGATFRELLGDGSMGTVEKFVRRVEASRTWGTLLARSGQNPIHGGLQLKDGRRNQRASANKWEVTLPRRSRSVPVILHEMAHSATPGSGHNWPFAAAYLVLVGRFISAEARDRLKAEYKAGKVRFTPPRKMSAETLARLRAQGLKLAALRMASRTETPKGEG